MLPSPHPHQSSPLAQHSWIRKHQEAPEKYLLIQGGGAQPWLDIGIIWETETHRCQAPLHAPHPPGPADVVMNWPGGRPAPCDTSMQTRQRTAVRMSCLPPLPALWRLSSGSARVGVQGVASCQPLGPGQTLLVPSVFRRCDPRKEGLRWRFPKCPQSTAMERGKIKLADVCGWLRKSPQKGCLATAGSLCSEGGARPWRQKMGTPASPLLLYLLGFLISVSGNFLLSVPQTQSLDIILDSFLSLTFHS